MLKSAGHSLVVVVVVVVDLNLARNFKMRDIPMLFSKPHYNKLPIWPGGMRGAIEYNLYPATRTAKVMPACSDVCQAALTSPGWTVTTA